MNFITTIFSQALPYFSQEHCEIFQEIFYTFHNLLCICIFMHCILHTFWIYIFEHFIHFRFVNTFYWLWENYNLFLIYTHWWIFWQFTLNSNKNVLDTLLRKVLWFECTKRNRKDWLIDKEPKRQTRHFLSTTAKTYAITRKRPH